MGRVRSKGRDMVRNKFTDRNIVQRSTRYVDPAMRLTRQNQDVLICTSLSHCIVFYEVLALNKAFNYLTKTFLRDIE